MAEASLCRYLSEAVWLPQALMPFRSPHGSLAWTPLPDKATTRRARATLTDSELTVSLDFEFDGNGHIVRGTGQRWRAGARGSCGSLQPWVVHYEGYEQQANGVR